MDNDSIQKAGSVKISELKLISSNNTVWDLTEFLIELNIFEINMNVFIFPFTSILFIISYFLSSILKV